VGIGSSGRGRVDTPWGGPCHLPRHGGDQGRRQRHL